ncbi:MAG: hypothetical protein P8J30_01640 [Ilumatobacter sp.]|nr:hypothetical protein [Ilumatobacter sp.]
MTDRATSALARIVETSALDAKAVATLNQQIHRHLLAVSPNLDTANFRTVQSADLRCLFDQYDRHFFDATIGANLDEAALNFRVSTRMTSAGGRTVRFATRGRPDHTRYEISVSATLLFQCFTANDHRPISVSGVSCRNRLEALQRIMEHELVHVIEGLLWERSNCSATRFRSIASRFFGHRGSTHALITPREHAAVRFGIRPGVRVRFVEGGIHRIGFVNRVTRRASVLVTDADGNLFSDGQRYATFYVPVEQLEIVETDLAERREPRFLE